jgi:hypothetical protein
MRRLFFLVALLGASCQNVIGPFEHRKPERVDDPCLTIAEQQREARARLPVPVETPAVAPPSGVYILGPHGRE